MDDSTSSWVAVRILREIRTFHSVKIRLDDKVTCTSGYTGSAVFSAMHITITDWSSPPTP